MHANGYLMERYQFTQRKNRECCKNNKLQPQQKLCSPVRLMPGFGAAYFHMFVTQ